MKRTENLGNQCLLKCLTLVKTLGGGRPNEEDFIPFMIVEVVRDGYFIMGGNGNTYKVKSKDLIINS